MAPEMEVQLLKRRISSPRAATVVAVAAVVALAVTVTPSLAKKAESFLTAKKAAATYVSNSKASTLYLRKKSAANLYVAKSAVPQPSVVGIAAGTNPFGPISSPTAGYIPTAFTSFATKANVSKAIITFAGTASCTNPVKAPTVAQSCPITVLVDGQPAASKVAFAPATGEGTAKEPAAAISHTIVQTTVLGKGGHTIQIQYAGASGLNFQLKSWNLAVQAYPQAEEAEEEATTTPTK